MSLGEVAVIWHWNTEHDFVAKITDTNTFGARTKRILVIMWQKKKDFSWRDVENSSQDCLDAYEIL